MGRAYYNEHDPKAAAWLRELIKQGRIAPGDVDERSIEDVAPDDLVGYTQCHFFAGIGVWSYALRCARWPDNRPVWTGSCPCQPFSAAGKGAGFADERHLWPAFHHLIRQCAPAIILGEQVASKDGLGWFDLVSADMEGSGYACGAVDLCAAGVGAPHIRQRLWWVAERMADADHAGSQGWWQPGRERADECASGPGGLAGWLADANGGHSGAKTGTTHQEPRTTAGKRRGWRMASSTRGRKTGQSSTTARPTNGFWRDADWLFCRDGKWRPVEPGTSPLAHGAAARVGRLRGYGNAIVAPAAQAFIEGVMEVIDATQPA